MQHNSFNLQSNLGVIKNNSSLVALLLISEYCKMYKDFGKYKEGPRDDYIILN